MKYVLYAALLYCVSGLSYELGKKDNAEYWIKFGAHLQKEYSIVK